VAFLPLVISIVGGKNVPETPLDVFTNGEPNNEIWSFEGPMTSSPSGLEG
jgi:hypothetical protein